MNIIDAIINLVNNHITYLVDYYQGRNRANNAGDALEEYVKDLFANSFEMNPYQKKIRYSEVFSYTGNNSNPPDAMLKGGDAIEIKKIESPDARLALNSSYPKQKLYAVSTMISSSCRKVEKWTEKDIIYAVGVVKDNKLKSLCMVYGLDYCASKSCYTRIRHIIKSGVESIQGVEFAETNELGRVNKIDPLGITYLRVRGMWVIENPWNVFDYIYRRDNNQFNFMAIINDEKWNTFNNTTELLNLSKENTALTIDDVLVQNPDNPAQMRPAKLIKYYA